MAGTRIPVYAVLELIEAGIPFEEIVTKYYPDLTVEDVQACVRYATELIKAEEIHLAEPTLRVFRIPVLSVVAGERSPATRRGYLRRRRTGKASKSSRISSS